MANLEVQIGADSSEFNSELSKVERQLQTLERRQQVRIQAGLDTGDLDTRISSARANLARLRADLGRTGASMQNMARSTANGGQALMQFSRIAQDAPFGIMGIGNNITATVEAFGHLQRSTGSAGGALKAMASSLMGSGGILLAVSLVTTALTVMSQKGITVSDVFDKLTGNFDAFKKELQGVNAESAKQSGADIAMAKAYVKVAQDETKSREDRLIAVKKLQDEYPAYFGNLTKEQILSGNITSTVRELTQAIIAKAKAQGFANKIGEIAEKEVPLREKELEQIKARNAALIEFQRIRESNSQIRTNDRDRAREAAALGNFKRLNDVLNETQNEIRGLNTETNKWQAELDKAVAKGIDLDFKTPPKVKKVKELHVPVGKLIFDHEGLNAPGGFNIEEELNKQFKSKTPGGYDVFASMTERMQASREKWLLQMKSAYTTMSKELLEFNKGINDLMRSSLSDSFGGIGDAIGNALANGTSVMESVGQSLIASMGAVLSAIGDKLIALGVASLLATAVFASFGSAIGIPASIAAIAGGVLLKAGGSLLSKQASKQGFAGGNNQMSAGNSVSTPTSSTNYSGGGGGYGNVVFEISGQSLVGVLSNTLNKNTKLGGTITI